jgi:hypothetical protein
LLLFSVRGEKIMTSPNTVQFTDLKVTLVPPQGVTPLSEESIPDNLPFQVVAEVEAGDAVFKTQQPEFRILAVVTDKTTGTVVATPSAAGRVGDPNGSWATQSASITLVPSLPKQGTPKDDHLYEVSAILRLGASDPDVKLAPEDVRFIITRAS